MKQKISVTIDEDILYAAGEQVKKGRFRNISHALEYGFRKLSEEGNHDGQ